MQTNILRSVRLDRECCNHYKRVNVSYVHAKQTNVYIAFTLITLSTDIDFFGNYVFSCMKYKILPRGLSLSLFIILFIMLIVSAPFFPLNRLHARFKCTYCVRS